MAFKSGPVAILMTDTVLYSMGTGLQGAAVFGIGNLTGAPVALTMKFYKQSTGVTTQFVTAKSMPANELTKIAVPFAMQTGDQVIASAASASALVSIPTVADSAAATTLTAINPQGNYSSIATYAKNDLVYVAADRTSYISLQDSNTGNTPSSSTSFWMKFVSDGAGYAATSTTSLVIGTGSKTYTTQAGLAYAYGSRARSTSVANADWMEGVVTAYSGTSLTILIDKTSGSTATRNDWNISVAGQPGAGDVSSVNNLGDLNSIVTSRVNLGLAQMYHDLNGGI